jgi:D-alanyl-lipoteichoic acid acyltransferase DltB (MBOAT superfamily)
LLFYAFGEPLYVFLLLFSSGVDYIHGLLIEKHRGTKKAKAALLSSIIINISLLAFFKYADFIIININSLLSLDLQTLGLRLPIGISFYTFQTMSYTIDVYRGVKKAEKHLGVFALYVSFFPQLVAGPVERSTTLLPQFYKRHSFNLSETINACKLIVWGLFKKIVIADQLGYYVNKAYDIPTNIEGLDWMIIAFFFTLQIYLDFSAYSDMAIGSAKIMGFDLMVNFNRPFKATSFVDVWKRWHMSLTTWFFDYLYRPLARFTRLNWKLNVVILFIVIGIWHGVGWNFVLYGLIHAVYYIISDALRGRVPVILKSKIGIKLIDFIKSVGIFVLAAIALITFRSATINEAFYIYKEIFESIIGGEIIFQLSILKTHILLLVSSLSVFFFVQNSRNFDPKNPMGVIRNKFMRWAIYFVVLFMLFVFGHQMQDEFIYFQF